jgi:uncharacterized membrane protein
MNQAASTPDPLSTSDHDELRLLYQTSVSDIAFFKQQQFTITNYALTLQAGRLFVAYQVLKPPFQALPFWALLVLVCAISVAGLLVIARLQASIEVRRERLARVRGQFGRAFVEAWSVPKEPDDFRWLLVCVLVGRAPTRTSGPFRRGFRRAGLQARCSGVGHCSYRGSSRYRLRGMGSLHAPR